MFSQDDDNQGVVLGILFGVIALVIGLVIGLGVYKTRATSTAKPAPVVQAAADEARVVVENGVVKFYFATAKADLAAGANEALADVVKAAAAGKKLSISGYHDATGDAALNEELAKRRAFAVRDALKALGVADDAMDLKKPEVTTGTGDLAQARRVEVTAQ